MGSPATRFLHITRVHGDIDPVNAKYRIVFAPLGGRLRSRHAQCQGLDALTDFLRQAGVPLPERAALSWLKVKQRDYRVEERGWDPRNKS
jgi:hypothetical protein